MTLRYHYDGRMFKAETPRPWNAVRYATAGPTRKYDLHLDGTQVIVSVPTRGGRPPTTRSCSSFLRGAPPAAAFRTHAVSGPAALLPDSRRCSYTVITMATRTRIVRIGNSRGIRIPKTLLDEANLPDEVELHAQPGRLVVQAARGPRSGWAAAAKRMRALGDDVLLDESTATKFDRDEWKWR